MEILTVKNLSFTYPLCESPALNDVSFGIENGEIAVLCGATGSGKSTLLKLLKREIAPKGSVKGKIFFNGENSERAESERIGFVMQCPDEQIVTDKVYSELAFGLENMGLSQSVIARRVAETASYFGIEDWYDKDVSLLSGGQKQLLNLASVMVMDPDILILDEPTAQLDPIAASDFLGTVKKLNRDFSLTVLITEHRLEELIPMCDRLLVMENGRITANGEPRSIIGNIDEKSELFPSVPTSARIFRILNGEGVCPLTIREGRSFLRSAYRNDITASDRASYVHSEKKALEFKDVYFRYERALPDVIFGLDLTVYEREIFCILGGNGSGKSTALACASGVKKIYSGQIRVFDKKLKEYGGRELYRNCLTLLPQDVQSVFLRNTVREELSDVGADMSELPFDISYLADKHPYDLSGGEQQLVALAKVLATKPRLLLMDEPTKGLDAHKKIEFSKLLKKLRDGGMTLLIVTHDVEFAAMCADRAALFFRGRIASVGTPEEFFSENNLYTTAASRMTKGYFDDTVTAEAVAELCIKNGPKEKRNDGN